MAAIVGLEHVQLAMPPGGESRARAFYGDVLGLAEIDKPPNLAGRGGCWFEGGTAKVHLGVEPNFMPSRKAHPALLVDDLEAFVQRLAEAGIETIRDEPLQGFERCYVSDPFGNRIELMQRIRQTSAGLMQD